MTYLKLFSDLCKWKIALLTDQPDLWFHNRQHFRQPSAD